MNYRIEKKSKIRIVGKKKWVSTENNEQLKEIPKMWDEFPEEKSNELISISKEETKGIVGVCADMYNNGFDYWIGTITDKELIEGMEVLEIPETTWAIFEVIGPIRPLPNTMQNTFGYIYSEWFPTSGYEHGQLPEIEYYTNDDPMKEDYKSEIWIPVIKK